MTQIARDPLAIIALGAYLLGKLAVGSETAAKKIGAGLRLERLIDSSPQVGPAPSPNAVAGQIGILLQSYERADYPAIVATAIAVLRAINALMDEARVLEACQAVASAMDAIRGRTRIDLGDLLTLIAGIVHEIESGSLDGELAKQAHLSRIRLYCATNGRFHDFASWCIGRLAPPSISATTPGLLGMDRPSARDAARRSLSRDGYCRFDKRLPEALCEELRSFAKTAPAKVSYGSGPYSKDMTVNLAEPAAGGFYIDHQAILDHPGVQKLIMDPAFYLTAQDHFGAQPIFIGPAMWWSLPFEGAPNATMAQAFHWDDGWFKWVKYFVYLVDVDPQTGPHTFIAGSHRRDGKPQELLARGYQRIPDDDLRRFYLAPSFVSFTGPVGSVFGVDTAGWHKGEKPIAAPRLVLQLTFANAVLGSLLYSDRKLALKSSHTPEFREFIAEHPAMFPDLCFQTT